MDELKCVWMSTNLIEDKLCNNNFDCDNCNFDKDMRKKRHPGEHCNSLFEMSDANILEDIIDRLHKIKFITFPPQYFFCNCFVLKKFFGNIFFIGFNPLLNILLDSVNKIHLYEPSGSYKKGNRFISILGEWGNVDISAPFDFFMESEVLSFDSIKKEYGKWLGFIRCNNDNLEYCNTGKEYFIKSADNISNHLKKYIKKYVTVGTTMYDGGEKLKYIYQVIGKENYIKVLMQTLS